MLGTVLSVAGSIFGAFGAMRQQEQEGRQARVQARANILRADAQLADLEFVREENLMAGTATTMAERAADVAFRTSELQLMRLEVDRGFITLAAEQQEADLRMRAGITSADQVAMAVAMGIDPFQSASFATIAGEQQRLLQRDLSNLNLNRMSQLAENWIEQANQAGASAAVVQQRGELYQVRASLARTQSQIDWSQKQGEYARAAGVWFDQQAGQAIRTSWMAGVGSLLSSAQRGGLGFTLNTSAGSSFSGFGFGRGGSTPMPIRVPVAVPTFGG